MRIVDMTARAFWKSEYGITGIVEDNRTQYQIKMDTKSNDVNNCSCSCERGIPYRGTYPHARLLLEYPKEQELEDAGTFVTTSVQV